MLFDPLAPQFVRVAFPMSLFFAVVWGLMFKDMLENEVTFWNANRETQTAVDYRKPRIFFTYAITSLLLVIFSIYSFIFLGFPFNLGAAISIVMVAFPAILIWVQLGSLLRELVEGGSKALDIDAPLDEQ
ncbi:MAG: hypothetical protein AB4040_19410 [Synechococcus sp.]